MRTILLATDGSPSAVEATATAVELARDSNAPLHVVTAWSFPVSAFGYAPLAVIPELADAERERAEEVLATAVALAEAAGVAVTGAIREGLPVQEICDAARELDASLVVVGAHGWGPVKRLVFGSVSTGVLHPAPCPVLVVRERAGRPAAEPLAALSRAAGR